MAYANALTACAMTGVIWFVQLVHYPLFAAVGDTWPAYHREHLRRVTWVVAPLMVVELGTSALLLGEGALGVAGLALAASTWLFTFALAVPGHNALEATFDPAVARRLITAGWLRTAAWTGHAGVALALLERS